MAVRSMAADSAERDAALKRRREVVEEMFRLREKAVAGGMKLLSEEEILHEIAVRRGEAE